MSSYSKKFVTSMMRDTLSARPLSIVRLFESPLQEVKIHEPNFETYTAINIEPYSYTLEEQLVLYPSVIVHKWPVNQNVVIDVE
jgi:hypothetical protein